MHGQQREKTLVMFVRNVLCYCSYTAVCVFKAVRFTASSWPNATCDDSSLCAVIILTVVLDFVHRVGFIYKIIQRCTVNNIKTLVMFVRNVLCYCSYTAVCVFKAVRFTASIWPNAASDKSSLSAVIILTVVLVSCWTCTRNFVC